MLDLDHLEALARAATPRAPHYAHPESEPAKATRALDAAVRHALPALLARVRALEAVAVAAESRDPCGEHCQMMAPYRGCTCGDEELRAALAAAKETT